MSKTTTAIVGPGARQRRLADLIAGWVEEGALARVATAANWLESIEDLDAAKLPDGRYAAVGYFPHNTYDEDGAPADAGGPAMWIVCITESVARAAQRLEALPDPWFPEKLVDLDTGAELALTVRLAVTAEERR